MDNGIIEAARGLYWAGAESALWGFGVAAGCLVTFKLLIPMLARVLAFRRMLKALRG